MAAASIEVGRELTAWCRRAIEEELGFLANPGRDVYFGQGHHLGRRFRMGAEGLYFDGPQGSFEIPAATIEAMADQVAAAFESPEYAEYHSAAQSSGLRGLEHLTFMTLVLCLVEDPLMYRMLAHASRGE